MKKAKRLRVVLSLALAAAAVVLTTSACTNAVLDALNSMTSKSFGLIGAWKNTNSAYYLTNQPPQAYLLTMNSDGTFRSSDSSGSMPNSGTYTIDSAATAGDVRTFTIHFQWGGGTMNCYALVRVTAPATYETNGVGFMPYPTSINPSDSMTYSKFTPQ